MDEEWEIDAIDYDDAPLTPSDFAPHPVWEIQAQARYQANKLVKVGEMMECACCGKKMKKKSYQSQFCSNKGRDNCKDFFWNRVDRKRLERAVGRMLDKLHR